MFGRSAVLPIDLKLSSDVIASPKMGENADELIEEHQIFRENMMESKSKYYCSSSQAERTVRQKTFQTRYFYVRSVGVEKGHEAQKTSWRKDGF